VFPSRLVPCPTCGDPVEREVAESHTCDPERALTHRMFLLRQEVAAFERQFREFADTREGRFEVWVAARTVRAV
jgi:hypothetical protein